MAWGKGWEVGPRKNIWEHERATARAAQILGEEHGIKHKPIARIFARGAFLRR